MGAAELGDRLPPGDEHAVSVSLPKWSDTVGWANRDPAVLAKLQAGYPRFFVPHAVRDLADRLAKWTAASGQDEDDDVEAAAMLFPGLDMATACQRYLESRGKPRVRVLVVGFDGRFRGLGAGSDKHSRVHQHVYMVMHPPGLAAEARDFWQHTGFGVSSRFAAYWLREAPFLQPRPGRSRGQAPTCMQAANEALSKRIAALYTTSSAVDDVFLYHTGMSAIAHTALALRRLHVAAGRYRVAVFGFLYVDTFKVLSKVYGLDCVLYGHADMDALEADLESGQHVDALYTEFPGNPLLGSLDLGRLYALSRKHGFVLVVDDTVGTPVNLDLAPYCHVICTSLTKMFSGACNVMGGSVVLTRTEDGDDVDRDGLRKALADGHADTYFPLDVVVMERNSADFEPRVLAASRNAARVADQLRRHAAVERVFYPRGSPTQHLYDRYRRRGGEYGYLLSIRFVSPAAAVAFHDALDVAKGPSLGTNFTLCCAYTLLAHNAELEWAAGYGVVEHLVRISVGIEDPACLERLIDAALAAAEHCQPDGHSSNVVSSGPSC